MGEKFYLAGCLAIGFLYQALLCFAFVGALLFFGLFDFFHQIAFAVTMQPGLIAVLAKFGSNVVPVHFKTCIHNEARKTTAYHANYKQYGRNPVLHGCKGKMVFIIYNIHAY